MSNNKIENPPAFPHPDCLREEEGMTLRDYFAESVLPEVFRNHWNLANRRSPIRYDDIANSCYKIADAMLEERSNEHTKS